MQRSCHHSTLLMRAQGQAASTAHWIFDVVGIGSLPNGHPQKPYARRTRVWRGRVGAGQPQSRAKVKARQRNVDKWPFGYELTLRIPISSAPTYLVRPGGVQSCSSLEVVCSAHSYTAWWR